MICPKCKANMKVTHSYSSHNGRSQRLACGCGVTATAVTVFVAIDPVAGQGVSAYRKRLDQAKTPPSLVFALEDGADKSQSDSSRDLTRSKT
jgi:hypothetical protein